MVIFHSYVKIYQRVGYPIEIITTYIPKKYPVSYSQLLGGVGYFCVDPKCGV